MASAGEASGSSVTASSVGRERRINPALTLDEDPFLTFLLAGRGEFPTYGRSVEALNRSGASALELGALPRAGVDELRNRLDAGEWVIDLRRRRRFAARHLAGSVNVEASSALATYVGWVVPWGAPVSLLATDDDQLAAAQRTLGRIGIEPAVGHVFDPEGDAWGRLARASYPVAGFPELAEAWSAGPSSLVVRDVRPRSEWEDGHLVGALHMPFFDIARRLGELPSDRPLWAHCAAGYRASLAASLLARAGRRPVLIDDEWLLAAGTGLSTAA